MTNFIYFRQFIRKENKEMHVNTTREDHIKCNCEKETML